MVEIKIIDKAHEKDINIPNEPFTLFGRMIPSYIKEVWSYTITYFPVESTMVFPDEHYDYERMISNSTFIGAYQGDICIGLAIMQEGFLGYMYLYDLKVNSSYRNLGVAHQLLTKAEEIAKEKGYIGIFTQAQDNNLAACLFYLKYGFEIGGFDNRVYDGSAQAGKADIFFYKRHSLAGSLQTESERKNHALCDCETK